MSCTTIGVFSARGRVGRTLLATSLAVLARRHVARVLLVDAGYPWSGDATTVMGLMHAKSLADLGSVRDLSRDAFVRQLAIAPTSGVTDMTLVNDPQQQSLVTPDVLDAFFRLATAAYDLVILDMPNGVGVLTSALLSHCDEVCVVSDATVPGLKSSQFCFEYLRSQGIGSHKWLFCVNKMPTKGGPASAEILRFVGVPVSAIVPEMASRPGDPDPRLPFVETAPTAHPVTRALEDLWLLYSTRSLSTGARADDVRGGDADDHSIAQTKEAIRSRLLNDASIPRIDLSSFRDQTKRRELRALMTMKVHEFLDTLSIHAPDVRLRIAKEVLDDALGLGPLEELVDNPSVTEIMVNRYDRIYVERRGRIERTRLRFASVEAFRGVIERIVAPVGRRIDEKSPMVDARLPDGSRVNAIIPPLSPKGPVLTIRKFSASLLGFDDLIREGTLNGAMVNLLRAAVQGHLNIVISGGTGAGKSTTANLLASFIAEAERVITIEDAAELQLQQPHVITLEARPPNIEGEGEVTVRDLLKNSLRMRPDRIVVGEVRGGEALDMLQALTTGHDGGVTTIHANNGRDALRRIETLVLMSGVKLTSRAIRDQIASAINLVVHQERMVDGRRRITQIAELTGRSAGGFTLKDIFVFETRDLIEGRIEGEFVPQGYVPTFVQRLNASSDISLSPELFDRPGA